MSWTLYDFGARSAQERAAQELLTASHNALDGALQSAVLRVATDYDKAQVALAAWTLARRTVRTARTVAEVAQGRMDHGVAPLSEVLQTRTALAQAQADGLRARDAVHGALGHRLRAPGSKRGDQVGNLLLHALRLPARHGAAGVQRCADDQEAAAGLPREGPN